MTRILVTLYMVLCLSVAAHESSMPKYTIDDYVCYQEPPKIQVVVTVYNPVASQCSGNPLVTASGSKIDLEKLKAKQLRWCALSPDLMEHYAYGDTIDIYISKGHKWNGKWVVKDRTNRRLRNTIDILDYDCRLGKYKATAQ